MDNHVISHAIFIKLVLPRAKIVELTLGAPYAQFFERMTVMHVSMAAINSAVRGKQSTAARTLSVRLSALVESWVMPPEVVLLKKDNPLAFVELQALILDTAAEATDQLFNATEEVTK